MAFRAWSHKSFSVLLNLALKLKKHTQITKRINNFYFVVIKIKFRNISSFTFGKNHNFYNKNIRVLFIDFIRKEKKFKNSAMLIRQIKKDIKVAKISLNKK